MALTHGPALGAACPLCSVPKVLRKHPLASPGRGRDPPFQAARGPWIATRCTGKPIITHNYWPFVRSLIFTAAKVNELTPEFLQSQELKNFRHDHLRVPTYCFTSVLLRICWPWRLVCTSCHCHCTKIRPWQMCFEAILLVATNSARQSSSECCSDWKVYGFTLFSIEVAHSVAHLPRQKWLLRVQNQPIIGSSILLLLLGSFFQMLFDVSAPPLRLLHLLFSLFHQ